MMRGVVILMLSSFAAFSATLSLGTIRVGGYADPINTNFFIAFDGSDSSAGTTNAPVKTWAKARELIMAAPLPPPNTNVLWVKRGSTNYESFEIPTNLIVRTYGEGPQPILSGASNLANAGFSLVGGKTYTYQYAIRVPVESNRWISGVVHSNVLMVLQNGRRLGAGVNASLASVNAVEAAAGSFYYDNANSLLYVHPLTNNNPVTDGNLYEACIRTLNLHGGAGFLVEGIEARSAHAFTTAGQQGYQALGHAGGTYRKCNFVGGWNHVAGVANSIDWHGLELIFDSCKISDGDPTSGPVLAIGYHDTINTEPYPLVTWTNCLIYQPSTVAPDGSVGIYQHGSSIRQRVLNCTFTNLSSAISSSDENRDNRVIGCDSAIGFFATGEVVSNLLTWNSGLYGPINGNESQGAFIDSRFVVNGGQNLVTLDLPTAAWSIAFTNCFFGGTNNSSTAFKIGGGGVSLSLKSNIFYGLSTVFRDNTTTPSNVAYANFNYYSNLTTVTVSYPTNHPTLAQWTNAFGKDINSLTTAGTFDPAWLPVPTVNDPTL
jgi:hypothetical protein